MKNHFAITLGLCVLLAGQAAAAPIVLRDRVRIGALGSVDDHVLMQKAVVLDNGQYLGWVENVKYVGNMVSEVKVSIDGDYRRAVWLFREDVKFDRANNVVVTSRTPAQIDKVSFLNF